MNSISLQTNRTSSLSNTDAFLIGLRRTQLQLQQIQEQVSSQKRVNTASDDPGATGSIVSLQSRQRQRDADNAMLTNAGAMLGVLDNSLSSLSSDLVQRAITLALQQNGLSDPERSAAAQEVDSILQSVLQVANGDHLGVWLFGGDTDNSIGNQLFAETVGGGIQYLGSTSNLKAQAGVDGLIDLNSNGVEAFGTLSLRVKGTKDLNVLPTAQTRLDDLNGALDQGIRRGTFLVNVDGAAVVVDLTDANTLGDVITRVNAALGPTGSIDISGQGLAVTVAAGHTVSISDIGQRNTAADLGIIMPDTSGPATVPAVAADLDPRMTVLTTLASLGATVDWTSGLRISQGSTVKVADFSSAVTVQDLITAVDQLGMGVRLRINDAGTGLDLVSAVSGVKLSIGENGGTTASDLGLRTFDLNTSLSDFRYGAGVEATTTSANDFTINLHDGRSFEVKLGGISTVQEVIDTINDAATAAGIDPADFTVSLATTGNGLRLRDNTIGGESFKVTTIGDSWAAQDLGILADAGVGSTINGADNAKVQVDSVFTNLKALYDALEKNDLRGITFAGEKLQQNQDQLIQVAASVGVRQRQVEDLLSRNQDVDVMEKQHLSNLQDLDIAEAITRLSQLNVQYQASLQIGSTLMQQTLFDFLR
ncbi:MAG: hypothetical protein IT441_10035 [Phycisphaeraceae bacterium]|nr:hypothetical protein [Phycisphaeraceae bacterium]